MTLAVLVPVREAYLNHPTFGLLYSICQLDSRSALFTTLYAQRLFFRVSQGDAMVFEAISRNEARQLAEDSLRLLRRTGEREAIETLAQVLSNTFS